jgi:serine/threonine protein phosphatase PrpC
MSSNMLHNPNTKYVLCSDGVWDLVSDDEIKQIVLQSDDAQMASEALVQKANMYGGTDNITAIVVAVE